MKPRQNTENGNGSGSLLGLLKAGLELGVAEASRKLAETAPRIGEQVKLAVGTSLVVGGTVTKELGKTLREDPDAIAQMAREVWSRGGHKEKTIAAEALGRGIGKYIPHRAVAAARELARMARNPKEAEMVGRLGMAPVVAANPALVDRLKAFMAENEPYVRRAAIASFVELTRRRKSYSRLAVEALLMMADAKEQEIRQAVRQGLKQIAEIDPRTTGKAVLAWAKAQPSKERVAAAKQIVRTAPGTARLAMERVVFAGLERLANGSAARATKPKPARGKGK